MRALAILAIVLVAVIMGVSAVAPAMANHPGPDPNDKLCDALAKIVTKFIEKGFPIPARVADIFSHCFP